MPKGRQRIRFRRAPCRHERGEHGDGHHQGGAAAERNDVSRADAPSETIASQEIRLEGRQVPIPFEVQYDPTHIDPKNHYTIQARILEGGTLLFIYSQAYPVLTSGNPDHVEVVVEPPR